MGLKVLSLLVIGLFLSSFAIAAYVPTPIVSNPVTRYVAPDNPILDSNRFNDQQNPQPDLNKYYAPEDLKKVQQISWQQLTDFPIACPSGTAITRLGIFPVCSSISSSGSQDFNLLYNFPNACPVGYAVQAIDHNQFTCVAISGGGSPAGSNTQVQFNDNNSFSASSNFTYDSNKNNLSIGVNSINGTNNIAVGNNVLSGNYGAVFGYTSEIRSSYSIASGGSDIGSNSDYGVAFGLGKIGNNASFSTSLGRQNYSLAPNSTTIGGYNNIAFAQNSYAFGTQTQNMDANTFLVGYDGNKNFRVNNTGVEIQNDLNVGVQTQTCGGDGVYSCSGFSGATCESYAGCYIEDGSCTGTVTCSAYDLDLATCSTLINTYGVCEFKFTNIGHETIFGDSNVKGNLNVDFNIYQGGNRVCDSSGNCGISFSQADANLLYAFKGDVNSWGDQRYWKLSNLSFPLDDANIADLNWSKIFGVPSFVDTNWDTGFALFDANMKANYIVKKPYILGDLLYGGSDGNIATLSGNTTTTQKFLSQTGTGTVSSAPSWQTIPAQGNLTYYLHDVNSSVSTYLKMLPTPHLDKNTITFTGVNSTRVLENFITDANYPNLTFIPAGQYEFHIHADSTNGASGAIYAEFWEVSATGVDIAKIGTTETTDTDGGLTGTEAEYRLYFVDANVYTMASTSSRIVCRVWFRRDSSSHNVNLYVGGEADSHIALPSNSVDATNFVPYSGATAGVNLGGFDMNATNFYGNGSHLTGLSFVDTNWQTSWALFDANMRATYNLPATGGSGVDTNEFTAGRVDASGVRLTDFNFGNKNVWDLNNLQVRNVYKQRKDYNVSVIGWYKIMDSGIASGDLTNGDLIGDFRLDTYNCMSSGNDSTVINSYDFSVSLMTDGYPTTVLMNGLERSQTISTVVLSADIGAGSVYVYVPSLNSCDNAHDLFTIYTTGEHMMPLIDAIQQVPAPEDISHVYITLKNGNDLVPIWKQDATTMAINFAPFNFLGVQLAGVSINSPNQLFTNFLVQGNNFVNNPGYTLTSIGGNKMSYTTDVHLNSPFIQIGDIILNFDDSVQRTVLNIDSNSQLTLDGAMDTTSNWRVYHSIARFKSLDGNKEFVITPESKIRANGGSANHATCWKPDGNTIGYCTSIVSVTGTCTCV